MSGVLDIVKGCPLFFELFDEEIMEIVNKCHVLSLEEGEFIFKEGDIGNEIYIILNGQASVEKKGVKLAQLRKGELFGELVILNENNRTADIIAKSYIDLLIINYNDIFGLYKEKPKIFGLIMLNFSRLLTTRLKNAGQDIKNLNEKLKALSHSDKKAS